MMNVPIDANLKEAIFRALDDEALAIIRKMPGVPPHELSGWLLARAGDAVGPFLKVGIQPAVLTFWFGLILGQRLKRAEEASDG